MVPNLDINHEHLAAFCQKWHINELSLFGSVLRNDFRDDSDVDFLVRFGDAWTPTLFDLVRMERELETMVGRSVDVVMKLAVEESRNRYRREAILSSYEIVYAAA